MVEAGDVIEEVVLLRPHVDPSVISVVILDRPGACPGCAGLEMLAVTDGFVHGGYWPV